MRVIKFYAGSLEEAKEKAKKEYGIEIIKNVSCSWRKAGSPSGLEFQKWAVKLLNKYNLLRNYDKGLLITKDWHRKNRKQNPCKIKQKHGIGKRYERVIELRDEANGELLGEAYYIPDAIKIARKIVKKYECNVQARLMYRLVANDTLLFRAEFSPSKDALNNQFIIIASEDYSDRV